MNNDDDEPAKVMRLTPRKSSGIPRSKWNVPSTELYAILRDARRRKEAEGE